MMMMMMRVMVGRKGGTLTEEGGWHQRWPPRAFTSPGLSFHSICFVLFRFISSPDRTHHHIYHPPPARQNETSNQTVCSVFGSFISALPHASAFSHVVNVSVLLTESTAISFILYPPRVNIREVICWVLCRFCPAPSFPRWYYSRLVCSCSDLIYLVFPRVAFMKAIGN